MIFSSCGAHAGGDVVVAPDEADCRRLHVEVARRCMFTAAIVRNRRGTGQAGQERSTEGGRGSRSVALESNHPLLRLPSGSLFSRMCHGSAIITAVQTSRVSERHATLCSSEGCGAYRIGAGAAGRAGCRRRS